MGPSILDHMTENGTFPPNHLPSAPPQKMKLDSSTWTTSVLALLGALALSSLAEASVSSLTPISFPGNQPKLGYGVKGLAGSTLFTEKQLTAFDEKGFLVMSGLLKDEMIELVAAAEAFVGGSKKTNAYFSTVEMGMIFQTGNMHNETTTKAFRRVALDSVIPQAAAELMRLGKDSRVRVLRDIFMSKDISQEAVCDWHVDDVGFWPESFVSEQHEGINVWIALEDMPSQFQGSMALAPGSHKANWRYDAYHAIGQNRSYHGGFTKEEMKQRARAGAKLMTTCEMRQQAPEVSRMIDEIAFIPDIKKGDIIFATRTLFHRTLAVTPEGRNYYAEKGIDHLNRYSIRYVPGSARLPQGWTFEWGIMANEKNAGKSLDEAMEQDSLLWYPQVWPASDEDLNSHLDMIASTAFDDVKAKTRAEVFELISLFSPNQ